jgi:hypothetical protein
MYLKYESQSPNSLSVGIDRTPFIAMVYVARKYNKKSTDAYAYVKEKHPGTVYHWDWIKMLK